jgi:hypothetical protein
MPLADLVLPQRNEAMAATVHGPTPGEPAF